MSLPAPFQLVFDDWQRRGAYVLEADWTTPLKRHVGAKVKWNGEYYFAKLAIAKQPDLDEPNMLDGLRREVWWSRLIEKLRQHFANFPFRSPYVFKTNVEAEPFTDEVAWVMMEFIDGKPIVSWELEWQDLELTPDENQRFDDAVEAIVASLEMLEQIHPMTLRSIIGPQLENPPAKPHGTRRWERKGLVHPQTAVLGNGGFEIKNFWRDHDGRLVILDNEFAGWYPKYDSLSYLYHRLYCNTMRPDLAKQLLKTYFDHMVDKVMGGCDGDASELGMEFWNNFPRLLKPRVLGGWYYDTVRRKLPPWHRKQRLRYVLLWNLFRGYYGQLADM